MKNSLVLFSTYTILISGLLLYSVIGSLPTTPISAGEKTSEFMQVIFPQGWGFFSKDPRSPMFYATSLEDDQQLSWPNMSLQNFFGINRFGRGQGVELARLKYKADPKKIKSCEPLTRECLEEVKFTQVENDDYGNQSICGKWLILETDPLPWAWSNQYNKMAMNSNVTGVDVLCSANTKKG